MEGLNKISLVLSAVLVVLSIISLADMIYKKSSGIK